MTDASGSRFAAPIRVGLLTPYFAFFEERFPPDFRASQEAFTEELAVALGRAGLEVTASGLVDGSESAGRARQRFADAGVEVIVAAATMAAPPTYGAEALAGFEGPVVVWDVRRVSRFAADVDEVDATRTSGILGSIMLANVLGREGRAYLTVVSDANDIEPVAATVRGAAAGRSLRGARLGLLGGIIPGYGDVVLDEATAASLGIELVPVDGASIAAALDASAAAGPPLPAPFEPVEDARPLVDRSLRVYRFLAALVDDQRLDALALNCHSDVLRFHEDLGIVACLGSSMLWSAGVPVACTGDAATAVALMLAARICGAAQYCEGYAVESETGEMLVSSCGMADVSLRAPDDVAGVHPNELYPGRHGLGLATRFAFAAGPATIAAFGPATPTHPARLVVSEGRLSGRGFAHLNGPSGTVGFDEPRTGHATRDWIAAGPAHHLALMRGIRTVELRAAAAFLGVDLVEVGRAGPVDAGRPAG